MNGTVGRRLRVDVVFALSILIAVSAFAAPLPVYAQGEYEYVEENDPLVREKLEEW